MTPLRPAFCCIEAGKLDIRWVNNGEVTTDTGAGTFVHERSGWAMPDFNTFLYFNFCPFCGKDFRPSI